MNSNLTDEKYFENVIRCGPNDNNGCCGIDGEWMDGQTGGCGYIHCPWLTVETCSYTRCAGSCGSENEISLIAVTKEQQFIDECNECGDCVCSNSEEPRFRTFACPSSESCPECGGGDGAGDSDGGDGAD